MDIGVSPSYDDSDGNQRQFIPQWLAGDRDAYTSAIATAAAITGKRNNRGITNELMEVVDMDVESPDSVSPIASPVVEKSFSQTSAKPSPDVTRHQQQAARSLDVASPPSSVDIASPTEESGDIASPIADDISSPPGSPMGNFSELDLVPKIIPTFAVLPAKKVTAIPPQPSGKSVPANQNAAKMKATNRTRDSHEMTEKVSNKRELLNSRALSTSPTPPPLPKSTPDTRTSSIASSMPTFSTQSLASELLKTAQSANKKHQQAVAEIRKVTMATEAVKSADIEIAAAKFRSTPVAESKKVVRSQFDDSNIDLLSSQSHAKPSVETSKYIPETEIPAKAALGKQSPVYAPRNVTKLDSMKKSETVLPVKQQQQQPVAPKKVSPIYDTSLLSSVQATSATFKSAQQTTKQPEIFRSSQPIVAEANRMSVQPKPHQPVYETIRAVDSDRMYNPPHVSSVAQTSTTQGPGLFERLKAVGLVAPPPVAMETEKPLLTSEKATTLEPAYGDNSDEVPSGLALLPTQVFSRV
jgi:hypothetical protein